MKLHCQSFLFPGSLALLCGVITSPLQAQQILPDTTLPNNSSITTQGNTSIITGGTVAESNLFHSFERFSVPSGGTASFQQIDQGIENVLSRVTGTSASNIDGSIELLQANGDVSTANFFFLNPNGISFGLNASLNVGGSFLATTASSLKFSNGKEFSATNPQATPLLTMSVPTGLQFNGSTGSIVNQSIAPDKTNQFFAGLEVLSGNTLALVGGDVALEGGFLTAPGGRIELGSVAGPGLVSLNPMEGGALGYEDVQSFGDIQLTQQTIDGFEIPSIVDVSGEGGGDVQVQGRNVTLANSSVIGAITQGSQNGGEIFIRALQLDINGLSLVTTSTFGSGKGGNVTIKTGKLLLQDGGQVSVDSLDGTGPGGSLTVRASDSVELVGIARLPNGEPLLSGLFAQSGPEATKGGNLSISTGKLIVRGGAQVNSTTFGPDAGNLTVKASEIDLVGDALSADGELLTEQGLPFPSGLVASTFSNGNGGTLTVETDRLSLRDGAVLQTSTFAAGNAGDLVVQGLKSQASESVIVTGTAKGSQFPTSIIALSGGFSGSGLPSVPGATGRGGNVTIRTGELVVQNGAEIATSSINEAKDAKGAGNLTVQAQTIRLDNQGDLKAETASGQGGDMTLQVQDLLLLQRNSNISTTAGIEGKGGDGGNITIGEPNIPLVALVALENGDITANASESKGGFIQITAQGVFGLEVRDPTNDINDLKNNNTSDISASSLENPSLSGVVEINRPDVELQNSLTQLSANFISPDQVVAGSCLARRNAEQGSFVVTGTGGLPRSPYEAISGRYTVTSVQPIQATGSFSRPIALKSATWKRGNPIQEAQGMVVTADRRTIVGTTPQLLALAKTENLICHSK